MFESLATCTLLPGYFAWMTRTSPDEEVMLTKQLLDDELAGARVHEPALAPSFVKLTDPVGATAVAEGPVSVTMAVHLMVVLI